MAGVVAQWSPTDPLLCLTGCAPVRLQRFSTDYSSIVSSIDSPIRQVTAVAFCDQSIVTGDSSGTLRLFSTDLSPLLSRKADSSRERIHALSVHSGTIAMATDHGARLHASDTGDLLTVLSDGDRISTVAWCNPTTLAIGSNARWVKLSDSRSPVDERGLGLHRGGLRGLVASDMTPVLASYGPDIVKLWDTRMSGEAALLGTIGGMSTSIVQVDWSRTCSTQLGVLLQYEGAVRVYSTTDWMYKSVKTKWVPSSFAMHYTIPNRILVANSDGQIDSRVLWNPLSIDFTSSGDLGAGVGDRIEKLATTSPDISQTIRDRAIQGYGLDISRNLEIVSDSSVSPVWSWMSRTLATIPLKGPSKPGKQVCGHSVHTSEARTARIVEYRSIKVTSSFSRDAVLLLWQGNLTQCVDLLMQHESSRLIGVAMSGAANTPLWIKMCATLLTTTSDPYLVHILDFISSSTSNSVSNLPLLDIALYHLYFTPDSELLASISNLVTQGISSGEIMTLALVQDDTTTALRVLEMFLKRTKDIQTTALLSSLLNIQSNWMTIYMEMLDQWKLWHCRANLSGQLTVLSKSQQRPPSVNFRAGASGKSRAGSSKIQSQTFPGMILKCQFCGQALAMPMMHSSGAKPMLRGMSAKPTMDMSSRRYACSSCNKSLPRCVMCFQGLSVAVPAPVVRGRHAPPSSARVDGAMAGSLPYEEWMVWCQSCRHGGHAGHLESWFKEHVKCPVVDCPCECAARPPVE